MEDELNKGKDTVVTPNLNQGVTVQSLQLPFKPPFPLQDLSETI